MARPQVTVCAALLVALAALGLLCGARNTQAAFEAPNELVGYRACVHLMLRLLDCLVDACELYLREQAGGAQLAARTSPSPRAGASGPLERDNSPAADEGADPAAVAAAITEQAIVSVRAGGEPTASTIPMTWRGPDERKPNIKPTNGSQTSPADQARVGPLKGGGGCWVKAIQWLKAQLLELRLQLTMGGRQQALATTLRNFVQLQQHLADACPGEASERSLGGRQLDSLGFILEAVQVVADIGDEWQRRRARRQKLASQAPPVSLTTSPMELSLVGRTREGGQGSGELKAKELSGADERAATETIKLHYSYLTQIITTYNLIFNSIDSDLAPTSARPSKARPLLSRETIN